MSGVLSFVGSMFTAAGQAQAGDAQSQAYKQQAVANRVNAEGQIAQGQEQRNIAIEQGQEKERQGEQTMGRIAAAYGAAGLDVGAGTPLEVMSDQASQDELAKHLTIYQGIVQQQSSDTQAGIDTIESNSALQNARAAKVGGYLSAAGTMFDGGAKLLSSANPLAMPSW